MNPENSTLFPSPKKWKSGQHPDSELIPELHMHADRHAETLAPVQILVSRTRMTRIEQIFMDKSVQILFIRVIRVLIFCIQKFSLKHWTSQNLFVLSQQFIPYFSPGY
jgi:hypothetical protein